MNRADRLSPAALVIYHPHAFAETLPSCSHLTVYQGETTSAHTCRALLSLPKQLHRLLCKPPATYTPDQIRRGSSETHSRRWL